MKLSGYERLRKLSEYIYFYKETVHSFEATRKIPTRGSKVRCILNIFWRDILIVIF